MRNVTGVLVLTVTLLAFAAPASATIVWSAGATSSGEAIVAANDDMTNVRTLVTAASLGMTAVRDPEVRPDGRTIVFTGESHAFDHTCNVNGSFYTYFGYYAVGYYGWNPDTGAFRITKYDPAPDVSATTCQSLLHVDPSIGSDGRVYGVQSFSDSFSGFDNDAIVQDLGVRTEPADLGLQCSGGEDVGGITADPSQAGRVIVTGCSAGGQQALILGGAGTSVDGGTAIPVGFDDAEIRDPSFAADGRFVVDSEDGGDPGLWINEIKPSDVPGSQHIHALASPTVRLEDPNFAFAGDSAILFSAYDGAANQIYALDRSKPCVGAAPTPCQFPADAIALTASGSNGAPDWTADPLTPTAGSGGTTTPGPTTTTPGGTTTTPGGTTTAPTVPAPAPLLVVPARVRALALRKGVTFSVRVGSAGKVSLKATVPARRIGRRGAAVTIATGSATATRRGTVKVRLKLTAAGRRVVRRLRGKTVTVAVTHRGRTTKRSVKLR